MQRRGPKKKLEPIRVMPRARAESLGRLPTLRVDPPVRRAGGRSPWLAGSLGWFFTFVAAMVVAALGLVARSAFTRFTQDAADRQIAGQIASLQEAEAAALVRGLVDLDDEAIAHLARALVDPRPQVAAAAEESLAELVARWGLLSAQQSTPRVAVLARQLAAVSDRVPVRRRPFLRDLAGQLLVWPIDPESPATGDTIACCDAILRLPAPVNTDVRVASTPKVRPPMPVEAAPPADNPLPVDLPVAISRPEPVEPPRPAPRVLQPAEPALLPGAAHESPQEPRRFIAPRAIQIDG